MDASIHGQSLDAEHIPLKSGLYPSYKDAKEFEASPSLHVKKDKTRSQVAHSLVHKQADIESKVTSAATSRRVDIIIIISFIANIVLACCKMYAAISSGSLAVLSSFVDSILDLATQGLFWYSDQRMHTPSEEYPAGRRRLEPVAVIISATLMGMAALEVIKKSMETIFGGAKGRLPDLNMSDITITILLGAIVIKVILWYMCRAVGILSPSANALAQDHRNDVLSNSVAIITSYTAHVYYKFWYVDPIGAILISLYIAISWLVTAVEQVQRLVGIQADTLFIAQIRSFADMQHPLMKADIVRAYHFGSNYLVEVEVILPETMSVREAHDISLDLQKKIEELHDVERAFVHVDYKARPYDEHKDPTRRRV